MSTNRNNISRRDFVKGAATGLVAGTFASMGMYSYSPWAYSRLPKTQRNQQDFGTCRSVRVTNISETSWFNNAHLIGDIHEAGGLLVNQYTLNWAPLANGKGSGKGSYEEGISTIKDLLPHDLEKAWEIQKKLSLHPENPGGYSCLLEVEALDGTVRKFLLDTGWSYEWMDSCFKREGIDQMLRDQEIEALFISHEHWDHFWGLPVTMKYDNRIPLYVHDGFYKEGLQYIKDSGYKGEPVIVNKPVTQIAPGMALLKFDVPIINRVFGETSLAFNIKDKGLVLVSGCNHQGILQFADFAFTNLKYDNDKFYGIYGGLHISPFEDWDPKYDDLVIALGQWGFELIGCNHCTGHLTAKKFVEAGYPVVRGTARFRSASEDYLGNGDKITFG
ncbi:7,8-dihydropterin-6-yl-methyl-4-(beta-D-ribofuranosyl)aminobenzene 5'-phosphate synthase [Desulfomicrobium macestii]|uniref:7, 8-dihydropterin-6-yl-methyl-4-(Beta-D-ribofuranosyl)aminobenzene 5'-phosphate synthase n=1 Tax=Desulfomicrobium macestii TaxID=90731 RepID=A0ABR9H041_9BACT|nr:MBL fold metallo-hydrolase [Desulfomicrobium macestii]MBE1424074.1 7,8-dihydropterin-6-yl-methyl-4-(beta-D-ribofuranosyl)aminobenzene 5'-phosphate synthase [Desulfomicrobium macestii]